MIWWYKDVFISRDSNPHAQQQSVKPGVTTRTIAKAYSMLKSAVQSLQSRRLNRLSYRLLNQLDDRYLADIGLINEDLYLLKNGKTPKRFQHTGKKAAKTVKIRLASSRPAGSQYAAKQHAEADYFDKAA